VTGTLSEVIGSAMRDSKRFSTDREIVGGTKIAQRASPRMEEAFGDGAFDAWW
jgi:hypothetical protein